MMFNKGYLLKTYIWYTTMTITFKVRYKQALISIEFMHIYVFIIIFDQIPNEMETCIKLFSS